MSENVTISVPWYYGPQHGPSEVDLIRALNFVIRSYMEGGSGPMPPAEVTETEIARAVNWLHAKYGGGGNERY